MDVEHTVQRACKMVLRWVVSCSLRLLCFREGGGRQFVHQRHLPREDDLKQDVDRYLHRVAVPAESVAKPIP